MERKTYDKEEDFENDFVNLLIECGWSRDVLRYPTEEELIANWADILYKNNRDINKLGDYPLTKTEMAQIIEQVVDLRTPYKLNSFINGKTVGIKRDNIADKIHYGKEVSLHIYDRREIAGGKSVYQIVQQPKFKASNNVFPNRRGDIMLLINGMPVFHVELKRSGIPIKQAYNQIEKYSRENIFRGLFSLIQIFIAMTPDDVFYYTNPGPDGKFNDEFCFHWADSQNEQILDWEEFTRKLLYIPMAHKLIGFYTVPDGRDGILKVLRSYQYYAVAAIENKVAQNSWDDKNQLGGYIWHTTGSGKTLTSFKAADLISKSQLADKVVFLVDRKELDTQSLENYKFFADDEDDVQGTANTLALISKLKSTDPSNNLIVTSIQKMSNIYDDGSAKINNDISIINKKRIVFIVDECHRDTFGDMMYKVKQTFTHALFFGFSGTPIQEENSKKGCTSAQVFGDELHRYTIGDGIRDGNVLAFDTYRVSTFKDKDIKSKVIFNNFLHSENEEEAVNDKKKMDVYYKLMNDFPMAGKKNEQDGSYDKGIEDYIPNSQYSTDEHIDTVVSDVLDKFPIVSRGYKFHALFATSSISEAIEYYRRFKRMAPKFRTTVLVDPSDNNENTNIEKIQGIAEVIKDYNDRYKTDYSIPTYKNMKKDVSHRLSHDMVYKDVETVPEKRLDMLIVVDQMLTGFDSKWINALYLDKVLRQENVIQAFSRTNRIFGPDKPFGMIYYYRRPYTMDRNIQEAVSMYSGNKPYGVFVDKLPQNIEKLNSIYKEIEDLFRKEDISDFSHLPQSKVVCAKFAQLFNKFCAVFEMVKVQGFSWTIHTYDVNITLLFTEETYLTLLQRYKDLPKHHGEGPGQTELPYDICSSITEIDTGKIDADYMNSHYRKWLKLFQSENLDPNSSDFAIRLEEVKKRTESVLAEFIKTLGMLPEDEQIYANQIIVDIQLYNLIPDDGKTIQDYISEYICRHRNDQIHRFASTFGLDEEKLRSIMRLQVTEENINEFGRFDNLFKTADSEKTFDYFNSLSTVKLSRLKVNSKFNLLLRDFIISGGFDI